MGDFYGIGIEIRAGFGLIGSTEKRVWADYEQILRVGFSCFQGQNFFFKHIVESALKSCIELSQKYKHTFYSS